jgi:phosphoribosylformylglycinamidine synthase
VALLDNFSWGDPRRPSTLGQLVAAVDGCVAAASTYQAPFVSGKDSLNNEWVDRDGTRRSVPPTLVITAVAAIDDVKKTITSAATTAGNLLVLLGHGRAQWCGSHAARVARAHGAIVPAPDPLAPARYAAVHALIQQDVIVACHDCSEGGVAVALSEMLIGGRLGAITESVPTGSDVYSWWFAESPGRLIVEVAPNDLNYLRSTVPGETIVVATLTNSETVNLGDETLSLNSLVAAFTRDGRNS